MAAQLYYELVKQPLAVTTEDETQSFPPLPFLPPAICPNCGSDDVRPDSSIICYCRQCDYESKYDAFLDFPEFNEEDFS